MATGQVRPRKAGNPDCPLGLVKTSDPTTGIRSEGWALEGWALGPPQGSGTETRRPIRKKKTSVIRRSNPWGNCDQLIL